VSDDSLQQPPLLRKNKSEANVAKVSISSAKIHVFPDILKKTNENLRHYRNYEIKRIDDDKIPNFHEAKLIQSSIHKS